MVGILHGAEIMCPTKQIAHQQIESEQDEGSSKGKSEELAALIEGHQTHRDEHDRTGE
jgi:hypothetical protein